MPAGTVTPLENVNGRIARRSMTTGKKWRVNQFGILGKKVNEQMLKPEIR